MSHPWRRFATILADLSPVPYARATGTYRVAR